MTLAAAATTGIFELWKMHLLGLFAGGLYGRYISYCQTEVTCGRCFKPNKLKMPFRLALSKQKCKKHFRSQNKLKIFNFPYFIEYRIACIQV